MTKLFLLDVIDGAYSREACKHYLKHAKLKTSFLEYISLLIKKNTKYVTTAVVTEKRKGKIELFEKGFYEGVIPGFTVSNRYR